MQLSTQVRFVTSALLIIISLFFLKTQYLLWGEWTYDQGFYFVVARLMDMGFKPYQEIHMSEQPLMALSTHGSYQLFGSIWGMQFFMVGYALLAVSALISVGRSLVGDRVGILAGLLFSLHFVFFQAIHTVNPETSSLSLALVSLACALRYRLSDKQYWLWISAAAMAGSFLLKLFMVVVVPLVLLVLMLYPAKDRSGSIRQPLRTTQIWRDWGMWLALFLGLLIGGWLAVGLPDLFEQSILFYVRRNAAHSRDLGFNLGKIGQLMADWPILSLLTLWGLGYSGYKFKQFGWVLLLWTAASLLFLMTFTPLREKHLVLSVPLFALLAALAIDAGIAGWHVLGRHNWVVKALVGLIGLIILGYLFSELITPFNRLRKPLEPLVVEERQPIVASLKKFTTPHDCIVADDPYIAFTADRMPPPWLSNLSYARFRSGSIGTQDLIDITNEYQCQAVFSTYDRIKNSSREYYDWARANYLRIWLVDDHEIMLGKPLETATPMLPSQTDFADHVELLGLDWFVDDVEGGNQGYFSLYWRTHKPFTQAYKIFAQLRDESGQTIASADHELFDGLVPTDRWPVGLIVKDTNVLILPQELSAGPYTLYVGFYDPSTLERLEIINDQSGEHAAVFPNLELP